MLNKLKLFLFENINIRQTIAKNTFWLFLSEFASRIFRGLLVIYAARILGTRGWGIFSYAITLTAFFTIFSDFGLGAFLTREATKDSELRDKYLSTAFFLKLIMVVFSLLLIIFVVPFFTKIKEVKLLLPIVGFILVFDGLREFGFSLNRALEKMEKEAVVKVFTNFAISFLGFIFLRANPTPYSLAVSYLIGSVFGLFLTFFVLRFYLKPLFSHFSSKLIKPIIFAAWPFALAGLLGGIMLNTDMLLLGWWRSAEEVGLYSSAQRFIQLLTILLPILVTAVFPSFARFAYRDDAKFRQIFEKTMALLFLIYLPIVFGGFILGEDIILTIFGEKYRGSIRIFEILLPLLILFIPNNLIAQSIFAYDKRKIFIIFLLIGAVGNVIFDSLLIPFWGASGAAWATILTQTLAVIFIWRVQKKINDFSIFPYLPKIILASLMMAGEVIFLKFIGVNVFLNVFISAFSYFLILRLLKEPILKEMWKTAKNFY